ncbi:MAG: phosphoribosylformylglycinamidine synthase [Spirochaetaceae bacterium]|jgi:phosphoribosylformylglycinamidine synthase|nr:phosphoribosylformylglycinamidine synthase [Spirochaetaceae bacterium]
MNVHRVYVEKKKEFAVEAGQLEEELRNLLGLSSLTRLRIVQRYDVEGIDEGLFRYCVKTVFSEPVVDTVMFALPQADFVCAVEYLPGQFDQRSDSAAQCIELITQKMRPVVASAKLYLFEGALSDEEKKRIEKYLINPVEARRADLREKTSLKPEYPSPPDIPVLEGFTAMSEAALSQFIDDYALAMDSDDIAFCQQYFRGEGREPTLTEIRVIDTYWSDHCRHTTFGTILEKIEIDDDAVQKTYNTYLDLRAKLGIEKKICLMDIATIGAKALKAEGKLQNWDISEEVNACSIKIKVDTDGVNEDWLLLFKNETHNHPTEIEPFGGAATCIGGAIRDPLSGRAYVYQAMRVTGAGNPLAPLSETLPGKLPQRKIVSGAAQGYSSYGNQIGLATSLVHEFYHPRYIAKRMEVGAVLGAVPTKNVRREPPAPGDLVILLGGRTGRDGCGGATGSSKAHKAESLETCGAEVQKGNAPVERKLQRLFRNPCAARLIKRCNDFGAGGVAVAIGELADGLSINLDAVPKKYEGLDGTELAISESQERMAVVVESEAAAQFITLAANENIEAHVVAEVSADKRLTMKWRGKTIVDLAREFLNSNGVEKHASVKVGRDTSPPPEEKKEKKEKKQKTLCERFFALAGDINFCSKKGLCERFDSTIGGGTVLAPFGGKRQLTPAQVMCAKIPLEEGETETCSGMAFGFDPFISEADPYTGAYTAVLSSIAKLVGAGFKRSSIVLSFQEYFARLGKNPRRWALPFSALLGALQAQLDLGCAAIGGKDSMSGSFEKLDVPPTLISFAVGVGNVQSITSGEFKRAGSSVYLAPQAHSALAKGVRSPNSLSRFPAEAAPQDFAAFQAHERNTYHINDSKNMTQLFDYIEEQIERKNIISVWSLERFGLAEAIVKMCLGNRIGFRGHGALHRDAYFEPAFGSFVCEVPEGIELISDTKNISMIKIGHTIDEYMLDFGVDGDNFDINDKIDMESLQNIYESKYESFMPYHSMTDEAAQGTLQEQRKFKDPIHITPRGATTTNDGKIMLPVRINKGTKPRALIPVFPGTNCESDTARALKRAGAEPEIFVIQNLTSAQTAESAKLLAQKINECPMLVLPGGFSGGDEPDGSAKLITAFLRGSAVSEAIMALLEKRDGLILGICNGFQALVKLGLVPFGKISDIDENFPTLTFNTLGRHQSAMVNTKVCSTLSPWFLCEELGAVHTIPVSHGEGRLVASEGLVKQLAAAGQIACQYVDLEGKPAMNLPYNPNGSIGAIEALSSADGRVLGKMAHSERAGNFLYKNIPGNKHQKLFEGGVKYFS